MKLCPDCGTLNPSDSGTCGVCGSSLRRADLHCSECGARNPAGSVLCDQCNTPLVHADDQDMPTLAEETTPSLIKGISTPKLTPKRVQDEDLPDWLRDLQPAEDGDVTEGSQPQNDDWLLRLLGDETTEESEPAAAAEQNVPEELPDWLIDWASNQPPADEPSAAEPSEDTPTGELPPWLEGLELPEQETSHAEGDWLSGLLNPEAAGEPTEEIGGEDESEAPAEWLDDYALEEAEVPESEPSGDLPSWLSTTTMAGAADGIETEAEPSHPTPAQELPDWLRATAEAIPESERQPHALPDWLMERAEPTPEEEVSSAELPGWLAGQEADEAEPEAVPVQGASEDEAEPDWLSGLLAEESPQDRGTTEEEETLPPGHGPSTERPGASAPEGEGELDLELPDWLAALPDTTEYERPESERTGPTEDLEAELPDWLAALAGGDQDAEEPEPSSAHPLDFAVEEDESDLSDALAEVTDSAAAIFSDFSVEDLEAETPEIDEDVPEWLRALSPPPQTGELTPLAPAFVPSEDSSEPTQEEPEGTLTEEPPSEHALPEWLDQLEPAPAEAPASPALTDVPEEALAGANMPDWLRGLRPLDAGPEAGQSSLPSEALILPPDEDARLVQADIPDWLQALRPQVGAQGTAISAGPLEPPEESGPLAGLRGIVTGLDIVDMPADHRPAPLRAAIPEIMVEQARLWQDLLSQPRSVERPVARVRPRRNVGYAVVRVVIAAILILGILGAFWLLPPGERLAMAPSPVANPWIGDLQRALEGLPAEASVLLAVDYGPAEAVEMAAIAEPLLQHLATQQVSVIAVSTLPEGAALIPELLASTGLTNTLPQERSIFLAGDAAGIASLLSWGQETGVARVLVLSSRAERLRWWVEQNAITDLPLSAGVSASIAPLVRPYLDSGQIDGGVLSYGEAVSYRELRGITDPATDRLLDVLMLTHWVALGILGIGFLYALAAGGKKGAG